MKKILIFWLSAILMMQSFSATAECSVKEAKSYLENIENFQAPPLPAGSGYGRDKEVYNLRLDSGDYLLPPTLTDALIADIWFTLTKKLGANGMPPNETPKQYVLKVFEYYANRNMGNLAGLRPWTTKNFLECLTPKQRDQLAGEIVTYLKKYGVRDPENWTSPEGK